MYDPTIGRWLTEDPAGLAPDVNPYRYVHNRPTTHSDPSGLADHVFIRPSPQPGAGDALYYHRDYTVTLWKEDRDIFIGPVIQVMNDEGKPEPFVMVGGNLVPLEKVKEHAHEWWNDGAAMIRWFKENAIDPNSVRGKDLAIRMGTFRTNHNDFAVAQSQIENKAREGMYWMAGGGLSASPSVTAPAFGRAALGRGTGTAQGTIHGVGKVEDAARIAAGKVGPVPDWMLGRGRDATPWDFHKFKAWVERASGGKLTVRPPRPGELPPGTKGHFAPPAAPGLPATIIVPEGAGYSTYIHEYIHGQLSLRIPGYWDAPSWMREWWTLRNVAGLEQRVFQHSQPGRSGVWESLTRAEQLQQIESLREHMLRHQALYGRIPEADRVRAMADIRRLEGMVRPK